MYCRCGVCGGVTCAAGMVCVGYYMCCRHGGVGYYMCCRHGVCGVMHVVQACSVGGVTCADGI